MTSDRQTDRPTDKKTDRQIDQQTVRQTMINQDRISKTVKSKSQKKAKFIISVRQIDRQPKTDRRLDPQTIRQTRRL